MADRLVWEHDGRDWPNRGSSRFVRAAGLRWHVQQLGDGPVALLAHGTGASTHSWRALAPLLAERFTIVAPDLPGHGFTQRPPSYQLSLPGMALALDALLRQLGVSPVIAVGHSAGAAILARMSLDRRIAPRRLVSLNGALLPLHGMAGQLFSPFAKLLVGIPLLPRLFARRCADRSVVERMVRDTGSTIEPYGIDLYARLARSPSHVAAALGMMANWDLASLERELPRLRTPLTLIAAGRDRAILPTTASRVRAIVPNAKVISLPGLGHLAHEERPQEVAELIGRPKQPTCRR